MARTKKNPVSLKKPLTLEETKKMYSNLLIKYKNAAEKTDGKVNSDFDRTYASMLKEYMVILMKENDSKNQLSTVSVIQPINIKYSK